MNFRVFMAVAMVGLFCALFWEAQEKDYVHIDSVSYRKAIQIKPGEFNACLWLGRSLLAQKSYSQAAEAFEKAIQIQPENFEARMDRALVLRLSFQFSKAVPDLEKAHQLKPDNGRARFDLFEIYVITAQSRKALALYPIAGTAGLLVLVLSYAAGLGVLLKWSFKPGAKENPSLKFALGWILIFFEGQFLWMLVSSSIPVFSSSFQLIMAITLAQVPVLIAGYCAFPRQPWGAAFLPPQGIAFRQVLKLAISSLLLCLFANLLYNGLLQLILGHPLPPATNLFPITRLLKELPLLTAFMGIVLAPIGEEIIFRGVVFAALRGRLSVRWTILVSALLFALCHGDIWHFLPLAIIGVALGWVREKTGSIWGSALLHMLNNGLAFLFLSLVS